MVANNFVTKGLWQFRIVAGLHAVGSSSLGFAPQVGCISKHGGKGYICFNLGSAASNVSSQNVASAGIQISHNVAHIFVRRLRQPSMVPAMGSPCRGFQSCFRRFKRHFTEQPWKEPSSSDFDVNNRIAGAHRPWRPDTLIIAESWVWRPRNLVDELVALAGFEAQQ